MNMQQERDRMNAKQTQARARLQDYARRIATGAMDEDAYALTRLVGQLRDAAWDARVYAAELERLSRDD